MRHDAAAVRGVEHAHCRRRRESRDVQRRPTGKRVAVVGRGAGWAIVAGAPSAEHALIDSADAKDCIMTDGRRRFLL